MYISQSNPVASVRVWIRTCVMMISMAILSTANAQDVNDSLYEQEQIAALDRVAEVQALLKALYSPSLVDVDEDEMEMNMDLIASQMDMVVLQSRIQRLTQMIELQSKLMAQLVGVIDAMMVNCPASGCSR